MNFIDNKNLNKPCLISYEEQDWKGVFFDWTSLSEEAKEFLEDELGDEMFDNENLVPVGVFSFADEDVDFSDVESYIENAINAEVYLMFDTENNTLHESGRAGISIPVDSLNLRMVE